MVDMKRAEDWVGRTEERWGCLTPQLAGMLKAAVSHPRSLDRDTRRTALLPRLWHWAAFPEFVPLSELGEDGHPKLGGFLPPLDFKRRMWAAGKLSFSGSLRVGERLRRQSEILAVTPKSGGTGEMVFVRVKHMIEGENGAFIEEEQDIVYLHIPEAYTPPKRMPEIEARISTRPCRSTRRGFSVFRRRLTTRTASTTICPTRGRWRNIPRSSRTGRCRRSC
jgi:3-methylfumaryl-CoA hydratase